MNRKAAALLAGIAATLGGGTWLALNTQHIILGDALAAKGYVWAATVTTSTGPVSFEVPLPDPNSPEYPQAHFNRYKVWHACVWGSPCSVGGCGAEAMFGNWWAIEEVVRHPTNPLDLVDNQRYQFTTQDQVDIERLTLRGGNCRSGALYGYFIPKARELGIIDPPPPPTVTPPPPPPPTPTPAPPVGPSTWSAVQKACGPSMRPGSICLEMTFQPSAASTGRSEVE